MGIFYFKQFALDIWDGVFPVTTDSILLGSWTQPGPARKILDVGTGSGILAVMLAQKAKEAEWILGMDKDHSSVKCAAANFSNAPWKEKLKAMQLDLAGPEMASFISANRGGFDLIVSNPPYFINAVRPVDSDLARQKHQLDFDFGFLARCVSDLLTLQGFFYMVVPAAEEERINFHFARHSMVLLEMLRIRHHDTAPVSLVMLKYGRQKTIPLISDCMLFDREGRKTKEYAILTGEYYLDDAL